MVIKKNIKNVIRVEESERERKRERSLRIFKNCSLR